MTVVVDGERLTLDEVLRVARQGELVELTTAALERMAATRAVVEEHLARGAAVYGLTTGVGERKRARVGADEADAYNRLMIASHRVGQGPAAPPDVVRATLLRLANGLARGSSGVRPALADRLVEALNTGESLHVRMLGSLGQADLAPMADVAHALIEETGFQLAAGEGLALISNNAFSCGLAALAVADLGSLVDTLDVAGALDLEAFGANLSILHLAGPVSRPYPGLRYCVERLRSLLDGSPLWDELPPRNLQDPLTFRCLPQVHGAMRDAMSHVKRQLDIELNAAQGNPLVSAADSAVVPVGNFDVLPLAAALDLARIALAPVLTSAAERSIKLLYSPFSGLPNGLAAREGLAEDALAIFGVSVQALTAEARLLAQPVSFELASTTQEAGIEDRTTMAPLAARRLADMVGLGARIAAIELSVAAQAVDLRGYPRLGRGTARAHGLVRQRVPRTGEGESAPQDLEPLVEMVAAGRFALD